jgi:hypothetical protein
MLGTQLVPAIKSTFEECEKIFPLCCMLVAELPRPGLVASG